jgi:hypothetical protein
MVAKLAVLILSLGVVSCVLLGIRQQRVMAAHEMADVQKRVARHDRELWKLRSEIARLTTPDKVEVMALKFGQLVPIATDRFSMLVQLETAELTETALTARDSGIDR